MVDRRVAGCCWLVGSRPRHAAIFAYTLEPGVFGRVLPEHEEAERERVRSDALLD